MLFFVEFKRHTQELLKWLTKNTGLTKPEG